MQCLGAVSADSGVYKRVRGGVYCVQADVLRTSLIACGRSDLADYVAVRHEETSRQQLMHAAKGASRAHRLNTGIVQRTSWQ